MDVQYKSPGFTWKSSISGGFEFINTDYFNADMLMDGGEMLGMNGVVTLSQDAPMNFKYRSDFSWTRPSGRKVEAWIQYRFNFNEGYRMNIRYDLDRNTGFYGEVPYLLSHDFTTGARFTRDLGSARRQLVGDLVYGHNARQQETEYITVHLEDSSIDAWSDMYRITPHSHVDLVTGELHFRDSVTSEKVKLLLDPGLRLTASRAIHENSGATAVLDDRMDVEKPKAWIDSTEIRERFNFLSLDFQPYLTTDLETKKVQLHTEYALSVYARELNDSTHSQGLRVKRPYVIGDGKIVWKMAPYHSLTFSNRLSVSHPSYLQVCWFDRSGGYIDRVYRGNPDLKPTYTRLFTLKYKLSYKRFVFEQERSYTHISNKITQTWFPEEIDGRSYRVFTWINGADIKSLSLTERISWKGKVLTAGVGYTYNYSFHRLSEDDPSNQSTDWSFKADMAVNMGKGWKISADAKYQSKVESFFELFGQYCLVNAKISKSIKTLTLYMEGRHLADSHQDVHVVSEDGNKIWHERSYLNRRIVVLGCSWKF